jgi:hypothetical protein
VPRDSERDRRNYAGGLANPVSGEAAQPGSDLTRDAGDPTRGGQERNEQIGGIFPILGLLSKTARVRHSAAAL